MATLVAPASGGASDRATGDWGGLRTRLADKGVTLEVDYLAEGSILDGDEDLSYLGNLDVTLTIETEKLWDWPGGTIFVYGEDKHGSGLSDQTNLLMEASSLEAEDFTQLAEFWLEQHLGEHVLFRFGKQDGNRDFASPRFAGNYVNSSFGVLPGSPLPSFPAPALGAAVVTDWTRWFGVRAAIYEGNSEVESVFGHAFEDHAGVIAFGSLNFHHDLGAEESAGDLSAGGWTDSGSDRSGVFGIYDVLYHLHPNTDDPRSFQVFVRGSWSPEETGEIGKYAGGGLTIHGFLGRNNTIGVGTGHARSDEFGETFVELFYKWRPYKWITVEPDLQYYDTADNHPVFFLLRVKLKL